MGSPGRLGRGISGHVICPQKAASSLLQHPSPCSYLLVFGAVIGVIVIVIGVVWLM